MTHVEEVNATFTHLLKSELFPPSSPSSRTESPVRNTRSPSAPRNAHSRRPVTFTPSSIPNLPDTSHSVSNAGNTPMHHHPPPAMAGDRERNGDRELSPASTLPPLPMHAPSTPTSGHGRAPGAGPSSSHHRAHQSQVALTSVTRTGTTPPNSGRKSAFSPPPSGSAASPSTPTRKRLLNFQSPSASRMAALSGSATGGMGKGSLEDMGHERYSLSPVGKESQRVLLSPRKGVRQISRTPFKVLDAPELAVSSVLRSCSLHAELFAGRFLSQFGLMVGIQCPRRWVKLLRLPMECTD